MNKMETTEEGSPGCSRCHATISTPDDHDPEDLCMSCAYDRILELEAEREALRREIAKGDEAIVALTAEVERLRPVVEAVKEERKARLEWAFAPNGSVRAEIKRKKKMEKAYCKITEALTSLASKEGEAK